MNTNQRNKTSFRNNFINRFKRTTSIFVVFLLLTTVASSVVGTAKIGDRIENVKDKIETFKEEANNIVENIQEIKTQGTLKERISNRFSKSSLINSFRMLSTIRASAGSSLLNFYTKYNDIEKTSQLKFFSSTDIDVDNNDVNDISAKLSLRLGIEQPFALSINFVLTINKLDGFADDNAFFRAYAEVVFPGTLKSDMMGDKIFFGYQSSDGERVPDNCVVTYKYIPYIINPLKKPDHKLEVSPSNDVLGKADLDLILSYIDSDGSQEDEFKVCYSPAVKTSVSLGRESGRSFEFEREQAGSSKVDLYLTHKKDGNVSYAYVYDLPGHVSFVLDLGRDGKVEFDTHGEKTSEIGVCDSFTDPTYKLYFADLPTKAGIEWQRRLLQGKLNVNVYNEGGGVDFNCYLLGPSGGKADISIISNNPLNCDFELDVSNHYFKFIKSNIDVSLSFSIEGKNGTKLDGSLHVAIINTEPFIISFEDSIGEKANLYFSCKTLELTDVELNLFIPNKGTYSFGFDEFIKEKQGSIDVGLSVIRQEGTITALEVEINILYGIKLHGIKAGFNEAWFSAPAPFNNIEIEGNTSIKFTIEFGFDYSVNFFQGHVKIEFLKNVNNLLIDIYNENYDVTVKGLFTAQAGLTIDIYFDKTKGSVQLIVSDNILIRNFEFSVGSTLSVTADKLDIDVAIAAGVAFNFNDLGNATIVLDANLNKLIVENLGFYANIGVKETDIVLGGTIDLTLAGEVKLETDLTLSTLKIDIQASGSLTITSLNLNVNKGGLIVTANSIYLSGYGTLTIAKDIVLDAAINSFTLDTLSISGGSNNLKFSGTIDASAAAKVYLKTDLTLKTFEVNLQASGSLTITGLDLNMNNGALVLTCNKFIITASGSGSVVVSGDIVIDAAISTLDIQNLYFSASGKTISLSGTVDASAAAKVYLKTNLAFTSIQLEISGGGTVTLSSLNLNVNSGLIIVTCNSLAITGSGYINIAQTVEVSANINHVKIVNLNIQGSSIQVGPLVISCDLTISGTGKVYLRVNYPVTYLEVEVTGTGAINGDLYVKVGSIVEITADNLDISATTLKIGFSSTNKYVEINSYVTVKCSSIDVKLISLSLTFSLGGAASVKGDLRFSWTGSFSPFPSGITSLKLTSTNGFEIGLNSLYLKVNNNELVRIGVGAKIQGDLTVDQITWDTDGKLKTIRIQSQSGFTAIAAGYIQLFSNKIGLEMNGGATSLTGYLTYDKTLQKVEISGQGSLGFYLNIDSSVYTRIRTVTNSFKGLIDIYWTDGIDVYANINSVTVFSNLTIDRTAVDKLIITNWQIDPSTVQITIKKSSGSVSFNGHIKFTKISYYDYITGKQKVLANNLDITGDIKLEWGYMPSQANCIRVITTNGFNSVVPSITLDSDTIVELTVNMQSGSSIEYRNWYAAHDDLSSSKDIYFNGVITITLFRVTRSGETAQTSGTLTGNTAHLAIGKDSSGKTYLIRDSAGTSSTSGLTFSTSFGDISGSLGWSGDLKSSLDTAWGESGNGKSLYMKSINGYQGSVEDISFGSWHFFGSRSFNAGDATFSFDIPIGQPILKKVEMDTNPTSFINSIEFGFVYGNGPGIKVGPTSFYANDFKLYWNFIGDLYWYKTGDIGGFGSNFYIKATENGGSTWDQIWPITHQSPIAEAGGPYSGNVGSSITFDFSGSHDSSGGTVTKMKVDWDGTGYTDWINFNPHPTHTYTSGGTYTLKLKVKDSLGYVSDVDTASVAISVTVGYIQGHVYNQQGTPINQAYIVTDHGNYNTYTDSNGFYSFTVTAPDTYTLTASKTYYTSQTSNPITVNTGETKTFDFYLTAIAMLTGYVKDKQGTPLGLATVTVTNGQNTYTIQTLNYGVNKGKYTFDYGVIPPGTYTITASLTGYVSSTVSKLINPGPNYQDFTLQNIAPIVSTGTASNVGPNSATLNGNLLDMGASSCSVWFEYGTTTSYGSSTTHTPKTSTGAFSASISELSSGTLYHFRACASNSGGTSYGEDSTFTTTSGSSGWLRPSGYQSTPYWHDPSYAYDSSTSTYAYYNKLVSFFCDDPLILTYSSPVSCNKFKINAKSGDYLNIMQVALYEGNTLKESFEYTTWPDNGYLEDSFATTNVDTIKIYFSIDTVTFWLHWAKVYDFQLYQV